MLNYLKSMSVVAIMMFLVGLRLADLAVAFQPAHTCRVTGTAIHRKKRIETRPSFSTTMLNSLFDNFWMFENATERLRFSSLSPLEGKDEPSIASDDEGSPKPKQGYQRIEEWDEEQKQKRSELSWNERVQFDGQRFGNQVRQNELLQRHLHIF